MTATSAEAHSGVMVGLEIHQQLGSKAKLFCACPASKSDDLPYSFERRLRPAQSELGRVDPAAVFEFSKGKTDLYLWSPETACLVDADEEPPHALNPEALEAALLIASTLRSGAVDEVHVMRKIVIDGSNTTGFQRTAVVALGGSLAVDGTRVGVQSVTIEEDAARIMGEDSNSRRFALDRLGIPLVEVALDPIQGSPEFVGRVALHLGRVLRSTGRVARGLGTVRQDLNVSVSGGKVVEVKGVQKLNLLPKVVEYEARRQMGLSKVAGELKRRGVRRVECTLHDVTMLMAGTASKGLVENLGNGGRVMCIVATGLRGMLGWEPSPGVRLGREVAEVARASSLGGVIHSDEFTRQGVSSAEEEALRTETGADESSGLILVAGPSNVVERAAPELIRRLEASTQGVPAETRGATEEGETRYLRPRPGAQRMYPETDVPDIGVTRGYLRRISRGLPEDWQARVARFGKQYSLSRDLALRVYDSDLSETFEGLNKSLRLEPSFVASLLVEVPVRLAREGVPEEALTLEVLAEVLHEVDSGRVAKEAAPEILREVGSGKGKSVREAVASLGLVAKGEAEVRRVVDDVIEKMKQTVEERQEQAFSPLMGEAMKQLRGRADGATVSAILKERLAEKLRESKPAG